jgi:predicted TIM-barrel fold metal-dependent hydrolase
MTSGGHLNISGLGMADAWAALTGAENLFVLSNGVYRQDYLERVARELGPSRLLFGSFGPYWQQSYEWARIENAALSAQARAAAQGGNAQRLYGL